MARETIRRAVIVPFLMVIASCGAFAQEPPTWEDVGALFAERCTMCHSGEAPPLGLRLDSLDGVHAGSENGPVVVPGDPDASELVRRIRGDSQPRMPLVGDPLTADEIAMVERWIREALADEEPKQEELSEESASPAPDRVETPDFPAAGEPITFAHVEPILLQRCAVCHSDAAPQGPPEGLRLDTYSNVLQGGERLVVLPGRPEHSELVRRIEGTARPRMPFNGPPWLTDEQIQLMRDWIAQGAADAEGNEAPVPVGREVRLRGVLTGQRAIDGADFVVDARTRIDRRLQVGEQAEMRGIVGEEGIVRATRLRTQ